MTNIESKEYGLIEPKIQEFDNMFRVELYRNSAIGEASEKHRRNIGEKTLGDTQQKIILLLKEDNKLSASKLAERIGVASRNIEANIKKLKDLGILIRHGSPKNGYWQIVEEEND